MQRVRPVLIRLQIVSRKKKVCKFMLLHESSMKLVIFSACPGTGVVVAEETCRVHLAVLTTETILQASTAFLVPFFSPMPIDLKNQSKA